MVNFAEELAYWYLRLNSFFLLQNFVLHRSEIREQSSRKGNQRGTAETDLLAIRFPYVFEEVGGQDHDWDFKKFKDDWGIEISKFNLAFIVQVKSGANVRSKIIKAFSREPLEKAIYRFGIFHKSQVPDIAVKLSQNGDKYVDNHWIVAKLAVTKERVEGPWLNLLLSEADEFIQKRIGSYLRKYSDRVYFPSTLIQYLTWKLTWKQTGNNYR
jgi:hypothetical protein